MNITKSLFCLIICAIALSCSKKDSAVSVCYLSTDTYTSVGWNSVTTYTYSNNRITALSSDNGAGHVEAKTFNYDAQGRIVSIAETYTDPSSGSSANNITLTYDANGRITQEVSSTSKKVITYNASGQMVKEESYSGSPSFTTLEYYNVYTYPSTNTKNYSTQKQYNGADVLQNTIEFVYDTKKSPEAVMFPSEQVPTNNVTQATTTYPGVSTPSVATYTYTYNSNGFPLTSVEKNNGNISSNTYSYSNCK